MTTMNCIKFEIFSQNIIMKRIDIFYFPAVYSLNKYILSI